MDEEEKNDTKEFSNFLHIRPSSAFNYSRSMPNVRKTLISKFNSS